MQSLSIEIPGNPLAKQSARFRMVNSGGKMYVKSYQKKEVIEKEGNMSAIVQMQLPENFRPFSEPIEVFADFIFPPLKSMSKKTIERIKNGEKIYKDTKPDCDNLNKLLADALEGVVFTNDSKIVSLHIQKYYGLQPKTLIDIVPIFL